MTVWSLALIRQKVRQLSGRFTSAEMTNEELDRRINQYYQFTFPAEVKLDRELVFYEFLTSVNQAYYAQPLTLYTNFVPPAYANNLDMIWYQDPAIFANNNPMQYQFSQPWTGDGVTTSFTTTVTGFPIFTGSLTCTDNVETFQDTNTTWTASNVTVTGSAGGTLTLNYSTGVVTADFFVAPASGQTIYLNYIVYAVNRPQAILMYDNQFQLFPVPDQVYVIKMGAYKIVDPLTTATQSPSLDEWGPCIAYGTARDISADYGELDAYQQLTGLYKEQVAYILTRTNQNMLIGRAVPMF